MAVQVKEVKIKSNDTLKLSIVTARVGVFANWGLGHIQKFVGVSSRWLRYPTLEPCSTALNSTIDEALRQWHRQLSLKERVQSWWARLKCQ